MAKRGWEREATGEASPMTVGARGAGSGGPRWVTGLLLVGAATLAGAYYLPLFRTHGTLVKEYSSLSESVGKTESELARARADLAAERAKNEAAVRAQSTTASPERRRAERLGRLRAELSPKMEDVHAAITLGSGRLAVRIPDALEERHGRPELVKSATSALCEVAAAATAKDVRRFTVVTRSGDPATEKRRWERASAAGASVARTIADKCHYGEDRIATRTELASGADAAALDLEIDLAE